MNDMWKSPLSNKSSDRYNPSQQESGLSDLVMERNDLKKRIASLDTCVSQLENDLKLSRKDSEHYRCLLQEKEQHIQTLKEQIKLQPSNFAHEEQKDDPQLLRDEIDHLNRQLQMRDLEISRLSWAHHDADFLIDGLRKNIEDAGQRNLQYLTTISNLENDILEQKETTFISKTKNYRKKQDEVPEITSTISTTATTARRAISEENMEIVSSKTTTTTNASTNTESDSHNIPQLSKRKSPRTKK